jgi:predicted DNA-binding protein
MNKQVYISVRVDRATKGRLETISEVLGVTKSEAVRKAILYYFENAEED